MRDAMADIRTIAAGLLDEARQLGEVLSQARGGAGRLEVQLAAPAQAGAAE